VVRAEFCASLLSVAMEGKTPLDTVLTYASGPNISTARNKICADFLTRPAPWLLMCDTDMVFGPDALDRLVAAADPVERPVVGALCYSQNGAGDPLPTMYDLMRKETGELAFTRPSSWPEDTCVKVSATGAAFLLIHRSALEAIRDAGKDIAAPWFRESAIPGASLALMGEDMTFCLRAGAAGIPVHVHTGVQVGHMKPVMLGKVT
jgi:GT2 family glycosyltransferase